MTGSQKLEITRQGIVCGAAGGLAEMAWVMFYAGVTGGDAGAIARGVTTAAGVAALLPPSPVALGIAVHMTLATALGVALAFAWASVRERLTPSNPYPFMLATLAGVWTINFFVILPIVSPGFLHMLPYAVSLSSKLLFGGAAAETIRRQTAQTARLVTRVDDNDCYAPARVRRN